MARENAVAWASKSSRIGMSVRVSVVMLRRYDPSGPGVRSNPMPGTWAILGVDLHVAVTPTRVRAGLEDALRDAVRTGRLAAGTLLPSSRQLAADLGLARNTVAEVYGQLVAE